MNDINPVSISVYTLLQTSIQKFIGIGRHFDCAKRLLWNSLEMIATLNRKLSQLNRYLVLMRTFRLTERSPGVHTNAIWMN